MLCLLCYLALENQNRQNLKTIFNPDNSNKCILKTEEVPVIEGKSDFYLEIHKHCRVVKYVRLAHHGWRGAEVRAPAQWGGGVHAGAGGGRQGPRVRGGGALYLKEVSTTEL
jgi:hypothetical protein